MSHRILNIAHRGASGTRPENTLASFRRAIEIGADMIELDVHATADGVAVVMHDHTVDRTTNGSGRVAALSLAELKALDAGSWFAPEYAGERVPTLKEAMALIAGRVPVSMELKETGVEEQAVGAIRQDGHADSFISSFSEVCLRRVRDLDAGMAIEYIVGVDPLSDEEITRLIAKTRSLGASILAPSYGGVTPALVAAAAAAGIELIVWTVDRPEEIRRMARLDITGITTNHPEVLREILAETNP